MKTYLITGCAGFTGSNFVIYMLNKYTDIRLINLDALTYAGNLDLSQWRVTSGISLFTAISVIKNW